MSSSKRAFGDIGERVACAFLEGRGFKVLDRNYLRKWGELDIVAERGSGGAKVIHFIEVKSMAADATIRAEENMHPGKLKRLHRAIETYLLEKRVDQDWQLDLVVVKIDAEKRTAKAEILENVN